MATQQSIVFAETIRAMKLAMRRRDNDSDSDESIRQPTNRGNKLKRNASHVREGRLDTTGGRSYRRKIDHAGYQRYIIQPNPLRYDEDGDVIDDDDDPEGAYASPTDDNPYGDTRLEELLAPLTAAAELSDHPSLSVAFTARALSEMAENARESLQRERQVLWNMKELLLNFRGDDGWVPVGKLETSHDILLLNPNALGAATHSVANETDASAIESAISLDNAAPVPAALAPAPVPVAAMTDSAALPLTKSPQADGSETNTHGMPSNGILSTDMAVEEQDHKPAEHVSAQHGDRNLQKDGSAETQSAIEEQTAKVEPDEVPDDQDHEMSNGDHVVPASPQNGEPSSPADSNSNQPQHRMTTRARARTPTSPVQDDSPSPSPAPSSIPPIHGFFHVPPLAIPDRDFGLPAAEAEETRRLLILFVQKQDQIVREAEQMFDGLLKADRMRKEVFRWSKAEAHVNEMSDGEDWYDKEEYKLDADLVKGKEEEEIEEEGRGKGRRRRGAQH